MLSKQQKQRQYTIEQFNQKYARQLCYLERKVLRGERLEDSDLDLLNTTLTQDTIHPKLVNTRQENHPEASKVAKQLLFITSQALKNSQAYAAR